jgi:hypothetical protein
LQVITAKKWRLKFSSQLSASSLQHGEILGSSEICLEAKKRELDWPGGAIRPEWHFGKDGLRGLIPSKLGTNS